MESGAHTFFILGVELVVLFFMFHLQSEFRYFSGTQSRGQGSLPPLYLVTGL